MSLHYLVKQNMCQSVHNHSNASIKRHDKLTNTSQQMLNVFAFGYDMRIKTSSPVINCLINDAVLDSELKSFLQALSLNVFVYDASHWPLQNASFPGDLMGISCVPGAPSWLSAKSLTVSMFSAVRDVQGLPLPSCRSVVLVSRFFKRK